MLAEIDCYCRAKDKSVKSKVGELQIIKRSCFQAISKLEGDPVSFSKVNYFLLAYQTRPKIHFSAESSIEDEPETFDIRLL